MNIIPIAASHMEEFVLSSYQEAFVLDIRTPILQNLTKRHIMAASIVMFKGR